MANARIIDLPPAGPITGAEELEIVQNGQSFRVLAADLVPATLVSANPTALVGLTAANGTAATYMTSDSSPALDQSISPVWTGSHSFDGPFILNATLTPAALTGDVNNYSPSGLVSANVIRQSGGAADRNITGLAGGSAGRIMCITNVGTTNNLILKNQSTSSTAANRFLFAGDVTLAPHVSILLRYDNSSSFWTALENLSAGAGVSSANPSASVGLTAVNGTAATFMTSDSAPALSQAIAPTWSAAHIFSGGGASQAPIRITNSANPTSPTAGDITFNSTSGVHLAAHANSELGVVDTTQFCILASPFTLTSQTGAQQLFNSSANGRITVAAGSYYFFCNFALSSLSGTSGTFGFTIAGGATFTFAAWIGALKSTSFTPAGVNYGSAFITAAISNLTGSNTSTFGVCQVSGTINVTVGGTIQPQVSLTQASAAVVAAGSGFWITPQGAAGVTTQGNWS